MSLEEALALSAPADDHFALRTATGTDGRRWYLVMEYWRTGRVFYGWCWDGLGLWIEEVRTVPAGVDWVPGYLAPPVGE